MGTSIAVGSEGGRCVPDLAGHQSCYCDLLCVKR
jgi:hypothetical protein